MPEFINPRYRGCGPDFDPDPLGFREEEADLARQERHEREYWERYEALFDMDALPDEDDFGGDLGDD